MNLEMVKQREYYCHNDVKNQTSQIKYRPLIEASNNVLMSFCPVPRMNVLEKTNHNKIKVSTLSTKWLFLYIYIYISEPHTGNINSLLFCL